MGEILSDRTLCEIGGRFDVRNCRRQPRPVRIHSSLEVSQNTWGCEWSLGEELLA
jgi:hypothetical protein